MDKRVYLEPRERFDVAMIDESTALYSFTKIIDVLMGGEMSWIEAVDYYCFNIEPLIMYVGLNVEDDEQ